MSIRLKILIALTSVAFIASLPLAFYLLDEEEERIIAEVVNTGRINSAMLARSTKTILLMNGGEILSSRVDSRDLVATFEPLKETGLVLAETIVLSKDKKRNGVVLDQIGSVVDVRLDDGTNPKKKSKNIKYSPEFLEGLVNGPGYSIVGCPGKIVALEGGSWIGERRPKKPVATDIQGPRCFQFIDTCKLQKLAPFCLVRMLISEEVALKPVQDLQTLVYYATIVVVLIALFIGLGFARAITKPIARLMEGVEYVGSGHLDHNVEVTTKDEIGKLAASFNDMSTNLERKIDEINHTNAAYQKFVPVEFLEFLEKQSILDIQLGDQTQDEMTILFTDIRAFSSLSENMTPEENFRFINSYLSRIGPIIRDHNGFIDKYIGDAIMALFPKDPSDAVTAACAMLTELAAYNEQRVSTGYVPIKIGIGIHTGPVMLGIIGEEQRREGTVISDAVNLASRLEGLTKHYKTDVIISEDTLNKCKSQPDIPVRLVDRVSVKGKTQGVNIFEVLHGPHQELKVKSKADFENTLQLIYEREFVSAKRSLVAIHKKDPEDHAVKIHYKRTMLYIEQGVPADWDGVFNLNRK